MNRDWPECRVKLQESKKRFRLLFDGHLDIVFFQDDNGLIIDLNEAALYFLKCTKSEIVKRPFTDLFSNEIQPAFKKAFQDALKSDSVRFGLVIPFEGKGKYIFDISMVPVEACGEVIGVYTVLRNHTVNNQSNNLIRREVQKLDIILESITDAFFTLNRNWQFTYVNKEFERLFHADRQKLVGENIWHVLEESLVGELYSQFHSAFEIGKPVHFEVRYEKMDKWLQGKAFPSEEGLSVFVGDVTEETKSKHELEKLSLVASKTTNGVIIMNAAGFAEWVNEGFSKLTGYNSSEVVGKRPDHLLQQGATDKATIHLIRKKRRLVKPFSEEMRVFKKSGEKRWLLIDVTPILNDSGKLTKIIAIQTDITERKDAEENQLQMTRDLFRQNRDLQEFTYIVSHNLRSPVSSIMGLADLLTITAEGSETFNTSIEYLKQTAKQLDTVLRDINVVLSIRNKKDALTQEKLELAAVCQQVIAALQEPLEDCGGKVFVDIKEETVVHGSQSFLYSIFYNLLTNAIKYRAGNRNLEVKISCFGSKDSGVFVSFSDNGQGFDVTKAGDDLFKLYKRFHARPEGRGFGLFLVKAHVEAMGGYIEVNSRINEGTTFIIYLK